MSAVHTTSPRRRALGVLVALSLLLAVALGACRGSAPAGSVTTTVAPSTTTTDAGAGAETTSSSAGPGATTSTTGAAKTGGLLKVGVGVATSADPLTAATPSDEFVAAQVFEQLTAITGTGEVAPLLATGWSSSAGGRVWVFNLRPDVRFHDDRPFEAADVVATFDPLTTGATSPEVATKFANIVTVLALDTAHVEFFLRAPDPLFPQLVADPLTSIRPRPTTEGAAPLPIGTGPFALRSFSTRDRAVLVRNAAYWRDDATGHRLPYLDEVQVFFGPDVGAEVVALQGGELQLVMALPPALAATVARDPLLALLIGPGVRPFGAGGFAGVDVGMTGIVLAEPWQRTSLASARFVESTKKP